MWKIGKAICMIFLAICSWNDIKTKEIPVYLLNIATFFVVLFRILNREQGWFLWIGGMISGFLFFMISRCTNEALGYGDSWIILLLGTFLGFWDLVYLLGAAFLFCALTGMICMIRYGWSEKIKIPFVPFLMIGYIGVLLK